LNKHTEQTEALSAVIYCRVSHAKQKTQGSGLESQEHRCRQYADLKGYSVEAVFPDDYSGGGDFMKRPGMKALLSFLDAQPDKPFVVIFDDLKRFARDTMFHFELRQAFEVRNARVECLNFTFEDTPEGRFVETIFAAQGELERQQNRRQTIQKMKARTEKGYWVFQAPIGYVYGKSAEHGKILVPNEPYASIIKEGLEGFAAGRFQSQVELKRFLESQPEYPKDLPDGSIRNARVLEMLNRIIYAGYIEVPNWGISLRKGHHEGLIALETYEKIQRRLTEGAKASARKDINEDFPLRGFILCDDCNKPLTAWWRTGEDSNPRPLDS
jgi:site-specific DNA recombinase